MERGSWWRRIFSPRTSEGLARKVSIMNTRLFDSKSGESIDEELVGMVYDSSMTGPLGQKIRAEISIHSGRSFNYESELREEFVDAIRTIWKDRIEVVFKEPSLCLRLTLNFDPDYLSIIGSESPSGYHSSAFILHYEANRLVNCNLRVARLAIEPGNPDSLQVKQFNANSFDWFIFDSNLRTKPETINWPYGKEVIVSGRTFLVRREDDALKVTCKRGDNVIGWVGKFPLFLPQVQISRDLTDPNSDFREVRKKLPIGLTFPKEN